MKKICLIASSGGHLEEIEQLKDVINRYNVYFVVTKTKATINNKKYKYLIKDFNRKNIIIYMISFVYMFLQQIKIFIREKPDIILTTGAGLVIPTCIISKIFGRKIICIESYARISTPSKTGKILYKISDCFIIQRKELKKFYPDAIYGGCIF